MYTLSRSHLVDCVVIWKMHGRLSGIGRLHDNSEQYAWVGMITLDNLRFTMAIHTGQYTSFVCFDTISCMICFIKLA